VKHEVHRGKPGASHFREKRLIEGGGVNTVFLNDICNFEKGSTGLAKATPGKYPLVATGMDRRSCDSFQFDTKAVCVPLVSSTGHGHASLKNVHYQEGTFALGSILVALTAKSEDVLDIQFLHLYLSELKDKILVPLMSGAANVALSVTKIKNIEIPLPSISRQQEIVVQFKSIVAEEKELNAELTRQQTLLKKFRQRILQEAIEGKLTADWRQQNPDVEPASELLARIQAEKEQLIKEKKIKKQKPLPPISEGEMPFELPEAWEWCRLGQVANVYEAGKSFKCIDRQVTNKEWGVLKTSAITSSFFQEVEHKYYQSKTPDDVSKKIEDGDLIFCRASGSKGLAGKCCLVAAISKNLLLSDKTPRLILSESVEKKYIFFHNEAKHTEIYYSGLNMGKSTSMNNITKDQLFEKPLPLPPLPEQKTIVTKVEKLLTLCDQLETQITNNQTHAEQLMQAVLKEAFSQNSKHAGKARAKAAKAAPINPMKKTRAGSR